MNIALKIVWKLITSTLETIGVCIAFAYVISGFGFLFLLSSIVGILESRSTLVTIINSVACVFIIASWVLFIIRWFISRIREEEQ